MTDLLPIYVLVDVVAPSATNGPSAVEITFRRCLDAMRNDPTAAEIRLSVVAFGDEPTLTVKQATIDRIEERPDLPVSVNRSYAAAFASLSQWMQDDFTMFVANGERYFRPLLLVLTDAKPGAGDDWEAAFDRLTRLHQNLVVRCVGHRSLHPVEGWVRYPYETRERPPLPDSLTDPVATVLRHLSYGAGHARQRVPSPGPDHGVGSIAAGLAPSSPAPVTASVRATARPVPVPTTQPQPQPATTTQPATRPAPAPQPTPRHAARPVPAQWSGQFEPFSVGNPGNAAQKVRPMPDPTEWDRRDTVLDGVVIQGESGRDTVTLRAASVRGLSHRYYGTVRQDEYAFRCTEDRRFLVTVVSDGVSNSKLSHKAAGLITRLGSELVAHKLNDKPPEELDWLDITTTLSNEIVRIGNDLIHRESDVTLGYSDVARHLAATALFAVVDLRPVDDQVIVHACSVGDSSAWLLCDGQRWQPLQDVKNSGEEVASSTTKALPARDPAPVVVDRVGVGRGDVLVLMSDGVGDALGDGTGDVGRFLADMWATPPAPLAFAAQVDFARRTHDDDRTALAIWPT